MSENEEKNKDDVSFEPTAQPELTHPFFNELTAAFEEHRSRLLNIARFRMNSLLYARMAPEDILQECYSTALKRIKNVSTNPDVPIFIKLRAVLIQTIINAERKYVGAQKRDIRNEIPFDAPLDNQTAVTQDRWNKLADSVTSPRTQLDKAERFALVRQVLDDMPETDREILTLRHFEEMSNAEAAAVLNIDPKCCSSRYIRALKHMQQKLSGMTGLRP